MLGASEFLAQVLPLFIQLIGLPVAVVGGYYAYKHIYLPRRQEKNTPQHSETQIVNTLVESDPPDNIKDNPMSEQNRPTSEEQQPTTQSRKVDTSDLPPLDMLLGDIVDDEPEVHAEPMADDEPPQTVRLRTMAKHVQHVQLNTGQIAPAQEIITILRDEDDGKLIIQIGDTAYRTLANNANVKQVFTQVMKELAGSVTKPDTTPPQRKRYVVGDPETKATAQPSPKAPQNPTSEKPMPSIRDLLIDDEPEIPDAKPTPKIAPPPPPTPDGVMPGDLPSFKLDDNPLKTEKKGRFSTKTEAEPVPELDLAAAIETYLQYKLQHTPEYAGRRIHIHGTPSGAIRIQVDQDYYDFVDEVSDSDVRVFLQATIAEWQDRQ